MNRRYLQLPALILMAAMLAGCSAYRESAKGITLEAEKDNAVSDTTGTVGVDITFHIPGKYINPRSRLIITPQLVTDSTVHTEYPSLAADTPIYRKKMQRRNRLEGYKDPYEGSSRSIADPGRPLELGYSLRMDIPEDAGSGVLRAVVSTDGCGQCSGIDTLFITGISNPTSLIDTKKSLSLNWIEQDFTVRPKIREGAGQALLQFKINRYDIDLSLGANREEMERMTGTIGPILEDTLATLRSMEIYGMASADGPFGFNTELARNRAASAKQWLCSTLDMSPQTSALIRTDSRPEGWWPVYRAMASDGHPDSSLVKDILTRYTGGNDDVQERYIRKLPCWKDIRSRYLPKDRKVEYTYTYSIRSFTTDEELLAMYRLRPDAFNEDELLRVAALAEDDSTRMEVYVTLMRYFPQSAAAANNLAVLYLRSGMPHKARQTLETQKEYSPEMTATLAASYIYEHDYERAVELLLEVELPQARYNLGLLKARQRKLDEAYELLREYRDVNSAITALSIGLNEEAADIMDALQDKTPLAEYVRAMIAARAGDAEAFGEHIRAACTDKTLRARAAVEIDFRPFQDIIDNLN